jgi:lathosterol oxidase
MKQAFQIFIAIFSISAIRYFVIAGIPFLLCYKLLNNWLSKAKIQNRIAPKNDLRRDILHSMQSTVVFTVIAYIVFYTPVKNITKVYTSVSDYPMWWLWLTVPVSLIIHDTYFYWMHRLLHHKKLFNITHVLHHRSTNPSPWTSYSFHILEAWTEGGVLLVIAILIPVHILSIAAFVVTAFIINVYGHLGYEIVPKRFRRSFMFKIFNTSVYHNLHHSKFKGNYGLYFRIWDRLLGTEHPDYVKEFDRVQQNRFGNI